jgi:hypothetical protein
MNGYCIPQGSSSFPLVFLLVSSTDHITGLTGATPVVSVSKAATPFVTPAGTIFEVGRGWYAVRGNSTDTNTLGPLALNATAAGADPTDWLYPVTILNEFNGNSLGPVTVAGYISGQDPATIVLNANQGSYQLPGSVGSSINIASGYGIVINQPITGYPFLMTNAANAPLTGLSVTAQTSLGGAPFVPCQNRPIETGNGAYSINLEGVDLNAQTVMLQFSAPGAQTTWVTIITQPE